MRKSIIALTAAIALMAGVAGAGAASHEEEGVGLDQLIELMQSLDKLLQGAIIITDGECGKLGKGWKRYKKLDGRFPVGFDRGTNNIGDPGDPYQIRSQGVQTPGSRVVNFCRFKKKGSK